MFTGEHAAASCRTWQSLSSRWDHSTSIPELMQSLNDMVRSGKVLYLGVSDTPAWVVAQANEYARQNCLAQFVVLSVDRRI